MGDERPRGFQPQRMSQVWADIDRARVDLGVAPEPEPAAAPWRVSGITGVAGDLIGDVVAWITEGPASPDARRDEPGAGRSAPASGWSLWPCAVVARVTDLLRQIPILDAVVGRVAGSDTDATT